MIVERIFAIEKVGLANRKRSFIQVKKRSWITSKLVSLPEKKKQNHRS